MASTPNNTSNVDVGRPKVGGYAFRGPLGTPLPQDSTKELNAALLNMGYVSNAGLKINYERSTTDHKDWNGDTVETTQDEYGETNTVEFIESLRGDLLKALFGVENVEIVPPNKDLDGSVSVTHNAQELENGSWVFNMASRKSRKRVVIPNGRVTGIGEVSFVANDLIRYSATIKSYPDDKGNCSYEYKTLPKLTAPVTP